MRILFVIDSFRMGGAEKSLATLLGLLPVKEMEIEVMRMAEGGELQPLLSREVKLSRVPLHSRGILGRLRFNASRAAMHLWRRFIGTKSHPNDFFWRFMRHSVPPLEQEYDIAVAYQQGVPTAYVATRIKARRKIAWVNADVGSAGYDAATNLRYYREMDHIVTVSDTLRTLFLNQHPSLDEKRVTVINDIIDPKSIRALSLAYDPYPAGRDGSLRLLTVARMERIKGLDIAIEAARLLRDAGVRFHWHILGDGREHANLRTLVTRYSLDGCVTLHGTVTNPYPWMRGCDIYIQPSRHEGYGIAIVEAMTLCRPVITTDFPVAHDRIDGTDGVIAPTSPEGIADAVTALQDPAAREAITRTLESRPERVDTGLSKVLALIS